ncbi:MAG: fructosamine kinase family protein [Candidatus Longimicrobiales bacterium M2_2A_002]
MSVVPDAVRAVIEAALADRQGEPVAVTDASAVGGGCISPTARLDTDIGPFFLKWGSPDLPDGLLAAEARGLRQLGRADEVRVPAVIAEGGDGGGADSGPGSGPDDGPAWLLLEWLEPGSGGPEAWARLGTELAALHRHRADRFGADADNYIGSLAQANGRLDRWPEFWRERRLEPQLRLATDRGLMDDSDRRRFDDLFDRLDDLLAVGNEDGPSLLHGDLWSGNVHMTDGTAAIIDPSVYHGHREVDLAMAELFGGFGPGFMAAYRETWPLQPGYAPTRRAAYQLYYLLVHVNLFGAGYVPGTRSALATAGVG